MAISADQAAMLGRLGVEARVPTPWSYHAIAGFPVEPIADPVLRRLAEKPDWREYEEMLRTDAVGDPWRAVTSGITDGWEIQAGKGGDDRTSAAAQLLAERARWMWSLIRPEQRSIAASNLVHAEWAGWRPIQVLPGRVLGPDGRPWWIPRRLIDKPPEQFRLEAAPAGERRLAFLPGWGAKATVFSPEEARIGWMMPQVRTLGSPYGLGLASFVWLPWRVYATISRKFYTGVDRTWNLLRVKPSQGAQTQGTVDEVIRQVDADVRSLLTYLNAHNVLLETGGYTVQWETLTQFIGDGIELLDHLKRALRTLIQGSHLTSDTADSGPAGSSTAQAEQMWNYTTKIVTSTIEPAFSNLFEAYLELNEGVEIDPSDLPRLVWLERLRPRDSTIRLYYDLGGTLRSRRLAELLQLGSVTGTPADIIADGDVPLSKPLGVPLGDLFAGSSPVSLPPGSAELEPEEDFDEPEAEEEESAPSPRPRRDRAGWRAKGDALASAQLDALVDSAEDAASRLKAPVREAVDSLVAQYLERPPPGKAVRPRSAD